MTEKQLQDTICQYLLYSGFLVLRINSGAATGEYKGVKRFIRFVWWQALGVMRKSAGVSDILALRDGHLYAIEVKKPGKVGNVSDEQEEFLSAVRNRGGTAIVADSLETVQGVVEAEHDLNVFQP